MNVKVKMRQTAAGPDGPFQEGHTYEMRVELASQYVNAGAAEWVGRPVEQAVAKPVAEERVEVSEPEELVEEAPKPAVKRRGARK